jgi:serine/threonine protein kinase
MLPWGQTVPYFRADSAKGAVVIAALPVDCQADPETEAAFVCAAFDLEGISGRGIPAILDHGVAEGMPFVAYAAPSGQLLSDLLARGPLSSRVLIGIAEGVLEALAVSHKHGMVHGEVCPENIIVDERFEPPSVALLGVGILPVVLEARARAHDRSSSTVGYAYRAPELLAGVPPTPSCDLYSLGALLHHMVSGHPPEGFDSAEAYGDLPQLLDVVRRSMSRDPERRYESATTMRAALDWVEVESERMNAHTQDIPLWMEHSLVGNIPVPELLRAAISNHPASRSSAPPPSSTRPLPALPSRPPMPAPARVHDDSTNPLFANELSDPSIRIEFEESEPTSPSYREALSRLTGQPLPMWAQGALAATLVAAAGALAWLLTG